MLMETIEGDDHGFPNRGFSATTFQPSFFFFLPIRRKISFWNRKAKEKITRTLGTLFDNGFTANPNFDI